MPFNDCQLSSKKLFDDTYLYFMEQQNNHHRPLKDVAMGIYELINHSSLPYQGSPAGSRDESPETTVADNFSYMNT